MQPRLVLLGTNLIAAPGYAGVTTLATSVASSSSAAGYVADPYVAAEGAASIYAA